MKPAAVRAVEFWAMLTVALFLAGGGSAAEAQSDAGKALHAFVAEMQPGVWAAIPNTQVAPLLQDTERLLNGYTRGSSGPVSVFYSWTGSAYDSAGMRWNFWGGGHHDYGGNEVYEFDFNTLAWKRLTKPFILEPQSKDVCPLPPQSGGPLAGHTYYAMIYSPQSKSVWLWNHGGFYVGDFKTCDGQNEIWEFDPDKTTWTGYQSITPPHPSSGGQYPIAASLLDPKGGVNFVAPGGIWHLDPVGKTIKQISGRTDPYLNFPGAIICDDFVWTNDWGSMEQVSLDFNRLAIIQDEGKKAPRPFHLGYTAGVQCDQAHQRLVFWQGNSDLIFYNIRQQTWSHYEPTAKGPTADGPGVESKFIYLPQFDIFAGYDNVKENVWLIKLPPPRQLTSIAFPIFQKPFQHE
jgi:hypothetical protein